MNDNDNEMTMTMKIFYLTSELRTQNSEFYLT